MTIKPNWPFIHYWLVFSHIVVNDPFVAEKGTAFICVSGLLISFLSQDLPCRSPHHLPVSCHHKFPSEIIEAGWLSFLPCLFCLTLWGNRTVPGKRRKKGELVSLTRICISRTWTRFALPLFDEEQQFSARHVDRERVGIFLTTSKLSVTVNKMSHDVAVFFLTLPGNDKRGVSRFQSSRRRRMVETDYADWINKCGKVDPSSC